MSSSRSFNVALAARFLTMRQAYKTRSVLVGRVFNKGRPSINKPKNQNQNFNLHLREYEIIEFIKKQKYENEEFKERLIETINHPENQNYIHYLSNPLLLSMFMLNFENYPELPKRKSRFYENVFNTLYQRHDGTSKHGFQREKLSNLKQDDFEFILKRFCFLSYFEGIFSFDEKYLKDKFKIIKDKQTKISFDNNDLICDLHVAISILVKEGLEYKFHHRSMQEYFVAMFIKDLPLDAKKLVYSQKLSSNEGAFDNQFNLWQLCFESDKVIFSENFIIPEVESFLEKIDVGDDKQLVNSFFNVFPLQLGFRYTEEEAEINRSHSFSFNGTFNIFRMVLDFIGLDTFRIIIRFFTQYLRTKNNLIIKYYFQNNQILETGEQNRKRIHINFKKEVAKEEFLGILIKIEFVKELRSFIEKITISLNDLKAEIKAESENDINLVDLI